MDPATLLILGLVALAATGKKKESTEDITNVPDTGSGSVETAKVDEPGSPVLRIDDVRPLFNTVKFTLMAGGQSATEKHKTKDETPTQRRVGDYMLIAITEPRIRPGQKHPDSVVIAVKKMATGETVIAKKVLVEDKKIIDMI